jgi:hypothetical protein
MATTSTVIPIQEIHANDAGLNFDTVVRDQDGNLINLANGTVTYYFQKPDGSLLTTAATFVTDGTDGMVRYTTVATDFDQTGTYRHQVKVVIGPVTLWSNINKFRVYPNLPLEG